MAEATHTRRSCARCGAAVRAKDRFCASLQVGAHARSLHREQRQVDTILFADLSGSTPLAARLDPDELRGILASYFGALERQFQRYEGTIDKYIGDAVMAVSAHRSHEDDARGNTWVYQDTAKRDGVLEHALAD